MQKTIFKYLRKQVTFFFGLISNFFYNLIIKNKCYIPFLFEEFIDRLSAIDDAVFYYYAFLYSKISLRLITLFIVFILKCGFIYYIFLSPKYLPNDSYKFLEVIFKNFLGVEQQQFHDSMSLDSINGISGMCLNVLLDSMELELKVRFLCMIICWYILIKYFNPLFGKEIYLKKKERIEQEEMIERMTEERKMLSEKEEEEKIKEEETKKEDDIKKEDNIKKEEDIKIKDIKNKENTLDKNPKKQETKGEDGFIKERPFYY